MKKPTIWGLVFLLGAGTLAFGQAALPAFHSGPWYGTTLPTGWTALGLRSPDYIDNYDGVGGNAAGLDSSSDYIQINFSGTPAKVSYYTKINGVFATSIFKIMESANGSTWTDVQTYDSGHPVPTVVTKYEHNLLAASRYVKFLYVTKVTGNVGLDGILIEGIGVPSITFDPSGNQSIPVSNLLTLAVSITPSGSGMQSWSLLSGYAGTSSLTNGVFQMTPAAGDSSKTFNLSVIATNSVGTSTGAVQISVTPYTPPVPLIAFSPAAPYSIMATETQKLGIGVSPVGSGIQGWTLMPSNYAGSAGLVGTNFTFIAAQTDGPSNYTVSVIATNVFGSTTGTAEIAVAEYVPPPPLGSVVVDFEDAPNKDDYGMSTNTLSGRSWLLSGATSILAGDKKFGTKSMRIRADTVQDPIKLCSLTPFASGIESISLWYASYGPDGTNKLPQVSIEISTNLNTGWVTLDTFDTGAASNLTYRFNSVQVKVPVYFRLRAPYAGSDNRANIDNIIIAPYVLPSAYDTFLLQYNVTPGDPGTAAGDDLDGDGFTNTNEFTAGTNPYDEAIHP